MKLNIFFLEKLNYRTFVCLLILSFVGLIAVSGNFLVLPATFIVDSSVFGLPIKFVKLLPVLCIFFLVFFSIFFAQIFFWA